MVVVVVTFGVIVVVTIAVVTILVVVVVTTYTVVEIWVRFVREKVFFCIIPSYDFINTSFL